MNNDFWDYIPTPGEIVEALFHPKMAPLWTVVLALVLGVIPGYLWIGNRDGEMGAAIYLIVLHVPIFIIVLIATVETWYQRLVGGPKGGWIRHFFRR